MDGVDGRSVAGPTRPSGRSAERRDSAWLDPFAARLDAALQHRGLPLTRVAHYLARAGVPISRSTLSNWRTGRSRPRYGMDDPVIAQLEAVLVLNPGTLTALLGDEVDSRPLLTAAQSTGQPSSPGQARLVMSHLSMEVDVAAHIVVVTHRHVIEAATEAVTTWEQTTRVQQDADAGTGAMAVARAAVGHHAEDERVCGPACITSWVSVPHPMPVGANHVGSWHRTHRLADVAAARVEHAVTAHQPIVIMQVRFRGSQPVTVQAFRDVTGSPALAERTPLRPVNGRYHAVFRNSVRGWCGLRWELSRP